MNSCRQPAVKFKQVPVWLNMNKFKQRVCSCSPKRYSLKTQRHPLKHQRNFSFSSTSIFPHFPQRLQSHICQSKHLTFTRNMICISSLSHFRDVPVRDFVQLHGGRRVHRSGHASSECRGGLRGCQGVHHPSRDRRFPLRAMQCKRTHLLPDVDV